MDEATAYRLLADAVLLLHAVFVAFVVMGLLLVLVGGWRGWHWVRNPWFRVAHLAAIGVVVVQVWLGVLCPLTVLEMALRERAGDFVYRGSWVAHWLHYLLYYQAPAWLFALLYSLFGLVVLGSWRWVPPRPFRRR